MPRLSSFLVVLSCVLSGSDGFLVRPTAQALKPATSLNVLLEPASLLESAANTLMTAAADVAPPESGGISYSKASYYTILGLYLMSFPGIWSQITRSTKAKVKRKTFITPGENAEEGKSLRQQAGEIMACEYIRID